MFLNFKHLQRIGTDLLEKSGCLNSFLHHKLLKTFDCSCVGNQLNIHISPPFNVTSRDRSTFKKAGKEKEAKNLENSLGITNSSNDMFPTYDIMDREFYGMVFRNIPIIYINATRNNTKMSFSANGSIKFNGTAGKEGFKNARKGTNLAGQATGVAVGMKAVKMGYKTVRVMVRGLGPGRMSSIKGLHLGGLNIVSITDYTITDQKERPRKQRRL